MSEATSSSLPADGQNTAARPSRDVVEAERKAKAEAKREAKAIAAAKKLAKTGGQPVQAAGPVKSAAVKGSEKKPTTIQGSSAKKPQAVERNEKVESRSGIQQQPFIASKPQRPMAETNIAAVSTSSPSAFGAVSLFGNVAKSMPASEMSQHIVSAIYRSQIHPSILRLAQHLSNFTIVGADARAIAVLKALRDFVIDYKIAAGAVFNRDLVTKLGPQISFLVHARPLGASAGHAIRYLKYEISVTPVELNEDEGKERILSRIDHFVRDRITYATRVIAQNLASSKIKDGDVLLTFARSSVVEQTIVEAWERGRRFQVIVVDARPLCEGRNLLASLVDIGIPCTYGLLTSLSSLISQATLVLLGTASLLANGALYSRAGTAPCAMMAKSRGVPVIVCCETYKFSERVQLDGFVVNEAANPTDILAKSATAGIDADPLSSKLITAAEWKTSSTLGAVNLLYDLTPPRYISAVASEVGLSGPESVGVILRDYKSVLYGQ